MIITLDIDNRIPFKSKTKKIKPPNWAALNHINTSNVIR